MKRIFVPWTAFDTIFIIFVTLSLLLVFDPGTALHDLIPSSAAIEAVVGAAFNDIDKAFGTGLILPFALMLVAVIVESKLVWIGLLWLGYELEWMQVLPSAMHKLSDADRWYLLGCYFVMCFIADQVKDLLRRPPAHL